MICQSPANLQVQDMSGVGFSLTPYQLEVRDSNLCCGFPTGNSQPVQSADMNRTPPFRKRCKVANTFT